MYERVVSHAKYGLSTEKPQSGRLRAWGREFTASECQLRASVHEQSKTGRKRAEPTAIGIRMEGSDLGLRGLAAGGLGRQG